MCSPTFQRRIAALAACLAPTLAFAGQLPARFTLGQYVPDNAWFYLHAAYNPDRAWVEQQWAEVFDALKNSGIDRDITTLVMSALSDEDRAKAEATIQKVTTLVRGVSWGDLARKEFVFSEGITPTTSAYGYVLLARGMENSGQGNITGLVTILKEVAALSNTIKLVESKRNDVELWSLRFGVNESGEAAFVADLLRRGDLIGLVAEVPMGARSSAASTQTLDDVLGLMGGQPGKKSILSLPRFQEAISLVKPPQDSLAYFDVKMLLGDFGRMFEAVAKKKHAAQTTTAEKKEGDGKNGVAKEAGAQGNAAAAGDDDGAKWLAVVRNALSLCNILDYSITTVETQGRRELTHVATRIQSGKESGPLAGACLLRKPFDRFDQFIPADATGFSLNGSIDLGGLYNVAMDFVSKEIPKGNEVIAGIKGKFAELGFDPQRDIFDWWSGEMIHIDLPAAVVTPMGGGDSVLMIRVKNSELASQKVNGAIDFISSTMQKKGQVLMVTPAKVSAEGFREITHPMFAMIARPVVGVYGDWLIVGKSASAVNKCLDVASGKTPSIRENKRFREEGLVPTGAVAGASFRDTSRFGQELAAGVGMIGVFGGMATAAIPDEPETHKVKQIVQSALTIVLKLGPILQKIDFYSSESSMTTYDGPLTVRKESVVTYKEHSTDEPRTAKAPTPPPPPTPEPPKPPRP
jgi:hypothetical protein